MNEKQKELAEVAKELIMFIRKNYTPQTTAIVTWSGVELLNTEMFAGVKEDEIKGCMPKM